MITQEMREEYTRDLREFAGMDGNFATLIAWRQMKALEAIASEMQKASQPSRVSGLGLPQFDWRNTLPITTGVTNPVMEELSRRADANWLMGQSTSINDPGHINSFSAHGGLRQPVSTALSDPPLYGQIAHFAESNGLNHPAEIVDKMWNGRAWVEPFIVDPVVFPHS